MTTFTPLRLAAVNAAAAAVGLALPAAAEPVQGFYMSGALTVSQQRDQDINGIDTAFGRQPGGYIASDAGGGLNAAAGWGFGNGFRAELELSYRKASFKRATAGALKDAKADGDLKQTGFFVNGYYDFSAAQGGAMAGLTPYLGAGLGRVKVGWDDSHTWNDNERVRHDSSDTATAAQIMAGLSWPLAAAAGNTLTVELRHTRLLDDLSFDGRVLESRFGSFPIESDVTDKGRTEISVGLRHQF